jgi:hypothetical protein
MVKGGASGDAVMGLVVGETEANGPQALMSKQAQAAAQGVVIREMREVVVVRVALAGI